MKKILILINIIFILGCNSSKEDKKNKNENTTVKNSNENKNTTVKNSNKNKLENFTLSFTKINTKPLLKLAYVSSIHGKFSTKGCGSGKGLTAFSDFLKNNNSTDTIKVISGNSLFKKRNKLEDKPVITEQEKTQTENFLKKIAGQIDILAIGSDDLSISKLWIENTVKKYKIPAISGNITSSLPSWKIINKNGFKIAFTVFNGEGAFFKPKKDVFNFWKEVRPKILKENPNFIVVLVTGSVKFLKSLAKIQNPPDLYISGGPQVLENGIKLGDKWVFSTYYNLKSAGLIKFYSKNQLKTGVNIVNIKELKPFEKKWNLLIKGRTKIKQILQNLQKNTKKYKIFKRRFDLINAQLNRIKNKLKQIEKQRKNSKISVFVENIVQPL